MIAAVNGATPQAGVDVAIGDAKVGNIAGTAGGNALARVFTDRVAKTKSLEARADGSTLTLRVPDYASFSLEEVAE